jgi:cell wall-associated NlpC family hydrolase
MHKLQIAAGLAALTLLGACGTSAALSSAEPGTQAPHPRAADGRPAARPAPETPATREPRPNLETRPTRRPKPTPAPIPAPAPAPGVSSGYVTEVPPPPECLAATSRIVGIKVYLVQEALGIVGHKERYDATTIAAVRRFQAGHGLAVDGIVGPKTWAALGIEEDYCVDQYTAQPTVAADATPQQRIEAMIDYATARLGTPYVWGGAGPMGYDCSGLALQAMYAGGRVVPGLDTNLHVGADFRSTHAIYESRLPHVPLAQRRRGDLVFFGSPISHMAIYLGDDRILEDVRPVARIASLYADGLPAQPLVVRPFPTG